jgi:hypothetical protein
MAPGPSAPSPELFRVGTAGDVIFRDGGASGTILLQFNVPANTNNPFSNLIHLDILLHTKSSLSIYDLQGRLIFEQLPIKNSNIDLSFLENGFYVFVINNNDKIIRNIMVKN